MTNQIEEIKRQAELAAEHIRLADSVKDAIVFVAHREALEALIAANELLQQVVVLEEGAEPMVGDVVSVFSGKISQGSYPDVVEQIIYGNDEGYPYVGNGETVYVLESQHPVWCYADKLTIIQRNGKPVIYTKMGE